VVHRRRGRAWVGLAPWRSRRHRSTARAVAAPGILSR
jgi:hypothetical protein